MSELENFLADIKTEGQPLSDVETATPPESQPETKPEEDHKPTQEGESAPVEKKVDFHEHPRFKALIEEKNALKAQVDELSHLKADVDSWKASQTKSDTPKWWQTLYGDSPEAGTAWNEYQSHDKEVRQQIKSEVLSEIKAQEQKAHDEEQAWGKWVDSSLAELTSEGLTFDRNKLLKIAADYQPSDENGNISLRKAYDLYTKLEGGSEKSDARKKLASMTSPDTSHGESKKDYWTSADIKKMGGWSGIK